MQLENDVSEEEQLVFIYSLDMQLAENRNNLFHGNLVFVLRGTSYAPTACPASWNHKWLILVTTQTWLQVFAEIIHMTIHEDINAPSFFVTYHGLWEQMPGDISHTTQL